MSSFSLQKPTCDFFGGKNILVVNYRGSGEPKCGVGGVVVWCCCCGGGGGGGVVVV